MAKQLKQYTRVSDINVGDAGVARGYSGAPTLRALRSGPVRLGQLARLAFPQRALVIVGSIASSRSGIAAKQSVPIRMLTPSPHWSEIGFFIPSIGLYESTSRTTRIIHR